MGMNAQAIQNIHKSDLEFTDEKDNKIDLSKVAEEPKGTEYDFRLNNHIVQDNMTENQMAETVNHLFAA